LQIDAFVLEREQQMRQDIVALGRDMSRDQQGIG